jgi:hypothetical protein
MKIGGDRSEKHTTNQVALSGQVAAHDDCGKNREKKHCSVGGQVGVLSFECSLLAPGYSTPPTRRRDSDISNARHRSDRAMTAYESDHVIVISVRSGNNTKPFMQVASLAQEGDCGRGR